MRKEIEIPLAALLEVADLLVDNEIPHEITAADESNNTITLEVTYKRDEREIIHQIEDLAEDHQDDNS